MHKCITFTLSLRGRQPSRATSRRYKMYTWIYDREYTRIHYLLKSKIKDGIKMKPVVGTSLSRSGNGGLRNSARVSVPICHEQGEGT